MSASLDPNVLPWLSLTKAKVVRRVRTYFILPVFQATFIDWIGASRPVYLINYAVSNNFTIATLPEKPSGANYIPCIKWRSGNTVYRYKLWDHEDGKLYVPVYSGQKIGKNFQIEIWTTQGATASQAEAINIYTSIRPLPSTYTVSDTDIALAPYMNAIFGLYIHLLSDTLPWTQTDAQIGADNP